MSLKTDAPASNRGKGGPVDILMYHSISDASGPTSIPAAIFRDQMAAIAEAGTPVVSLDDVAEWLTGNRKLPAGAVALTFDDGFQDFADTAFPILHDHGFAATVYLPTDHIGGNENWRGANDPPRPLMDWAAVSDLARQGIDFGGHSLTHADLPSLSGQMLADEVHRCQDVIAGHTGRKPRHFAPPYGRATAETIQTVRRWYTTSAGTRLDRCRSNSNPFDLPRLEMFYYTDLPRWRAHLAGKGGAYLLARQGLRAVRERISKPWARQ